MDLTKFQSEMIHIQFQGQQVEMEMLNNQQHHSQARLELTHLALYDEVFL